MISSLAQQSVSLIPLWVILGYLLLLVGLGAVSARFFRGTSADFFVASRSIGPVLLLMSLFGTTMTAFSLVGSTGKAFDQGIGVYGLMASWSGLVHSAVFFFVGIRLWAIGKRHGFVTQVQYFRGRFDSTAIGYLLFPALVALVIPYLLMGLLSAGGVMMGISSGWFPEVFAATEGAIPRWVSGLVISGVVLSYVFTAGVRATAWANTFQTLVFMVTGVVAFYMIARAMGGPAAASAMVAEHRGEHLARQGQFGQMQFWSYMFIPLSVGMFPHVFQHWLTARSAKTFRLAVVAHPIFILIVWAPCVLLGVWGAGLVASGELAAPPSANALLGVMVEQLIASPVLAGILVAGILAAIMSSLDSQFVCMGTMFTNDVVVRAFGKDRFTDGQKMWMGRGFIIAIVAVTYVLSLAEPTHVFNLGVWCFTGFSGLFPLVVGALYWRRTTRAGALACIGTAAVAWFALFFDGLVRFTDFAAARGVSQTPWFGRVHEAGDYLVLGMMPVAMVVALSSVALVGVSLVTRPLPEAVVAGFFPPRKRIDNTKAEPETVGGQSS